MKIFGIIGDKIFSAVARIRAYFCLINKKGAITIASVFFITAGAAIYITLLMVSFHAGIELRAINARVSEETRETTQLELAFREQEANFAERHADMLGRMEKISSVKYLAPENVAMRR